jgi:FKBP-type peptidyl-prolyl cis-trans isomerase
MRGTAVLTLLALLLAAASAAAAGPQMKSDDDKVIYTMGYSLARNLAPFDLDARELEILKQGLTDSVSGKDSAVPLPEYGPKIKELAQKRTMAAAEKEKAHAAAFVAAAAKEPGARVTESGLVYRETLAGKGESPKPSDRVRVNYTGTLRTGKVFDSSVERGEPAVFPLTGVIHCWTEALQLMKVGGKATITCPPDLAYGPRATGAIPAGSALRFDVELLGIEK